MAILQFYILHDLQNDKKNEDNDHVPIPENDYHILMRGTWSAKEEWMIELKVGNNENGWG